MVHTALPDRVSLLHCCCTVISDECLSRNTSHDCKHSPRASRVQGAIVVAGGSLVAILLRSGKMLCKMILSLSDLYICKKVVLGIHFWLKTPESHSEDYKKFLLS